MEILLGAFGMAVITGVFTFATLMINKSQEHVQNAREDKKFYRDQLMPVLQAQQKTLEAQQEAFDSMKEDLTKVDEDLTKVATLLREVSA